MTLRSLLILSGLLIISDSGIHCFTTRSFYKIVGPLAYLLVNMNEAYVHTFKHTLNSHSLLLSSKESVCPSLHPASELSPSLLCTFPCEIQWVKQNPHPRYLTILVIWSSASSSTTHQVMSAHPCLSSARILLGLFSQNPCYPCYFCGMLFTPKNMCCTWMPWLTQNGRWAGHGKSSTILHMGCYEKNMTELIPKTLATIQLVKTPDQMDMGIAHKGTARKK